MDPFAAVILLLITFMAYVQGITWLFIGGLILILILVRSVSVFLAAVGGILLLEFLGMQEYWFIVLAIIAGLILWKEHRKKKGSEYYSPEMAQLLEG